MIDYVSQNRSVILAALGQHVWLSLLPVVIGAALALPFGYLAVRSPRLYQPIVNTGGDHLLDPLAGAVPDAAAGARPPGAGPAEHGCRRCPCTPSPCSPARSPTRSSPCRARPPGGARALGYRPLRQLLGVELPMALPVMLAGLRVATVANISLVSVGAFIGVGGLGALFTSGLQLGFVEPIVVGIVLSVLLAAACDVGLVLLQRWLTPWTRIGSDAAVTAVDHAACR